MNKSALFCCYESPMMQKTKKRCGIMSSAESIVDYEDILTEILVRVPARPLVRFKCVSKRWLFLISEPKFCHFHTRRNPHPSISAYYTPSSRYYLCTLNLPSNVSNYGNYNLTVYERSSSSHPLNFVDSDVEIVQSCNGLFLCRLQYPEARHPTIASLLVYYVFNPTTNKFCSLTPPAAAAAATITENRVFGYALAFDPSRSPHYKVVFLWFVHEQFSGQLYYHIEIYSSETRSWRLIDSSFEYHSSFIYRHGVYFNGAVHWASDNCGMLYYHIDEERVGLVDGIPEDDDMYYGSVLSRYFRESHGGTRLHLIDIRRGDIRFLTKLEVFEMAKDYSGWSVKYIIDLNPVCNVYPDMLEHFFVVLSVAAEEKDEESSALLQLHFGGKVIDYNLRNNTFKSSEVTTKGDYSEKSFAHLRRNFHYVESLAVV